MIKGIGIDIVEIQRVKRSLQKSDRFMYRILTEKEIDLYKQLQTDTRKLEYIAGRFAAKEAYAKAYGTGIGKLSFKDIEIINDDRGAPKMHVGKDCTHNIFVSISHSEAYAVAQVVIEE